MNHEKTKTKIAVDEKVLTARIPEEQEGERLDKVLPRLFKGYSRSTLQQWLQEGRVVVNGVIPRKRDPVTPGEDITVTLPEIEAPDEWVAEEIALDIIYEDEAILVINKPAALVVHPGAGNMRGTLLNAVLHYDPLLATLPRAGIVHRLDKETSGLMVLARTEPVRLDLIKRIKEREVNREYLAVIHGRPIAGGTIDAPMGRSPHDRRRMAVTGRGKPAVTHYRVEARYRTSTLIRVKLETGRTHQIRVHMAHEGYPLLGDPVYGGRLRLPPEASQELIDLLRSFKRQALHATSLAFEHPVSGEPLSFIQSLPEDMRQLTQMLAQDQQEHSH